MKCAPLVALVAAVAPSFSPVQAQTIRVFNASRPVAGERLLHVTLDFAGGHVTVGPSVDGQLYRMDLHYDADRYAPVQQYQPQTGVLRLGVDAIGGAGIRVSSGRRVEQSAHFAFSPTVPLALDASLSASEATLDLGGTTLATLAVRSAATQAMIDFSRPTQGVCTSATFTVGAGQLDVHHLAQAGCGVLRLDGGVGGTSLDFDGVWRRDMALVVDLAMGSLTLRIPRGTGVRLSADRFLSTMDTKGFVRDGNTWTTPDYAGALHKLTVDLKTSIAGIDVQWIEP